MNRKSVSAAIEREKHMRKILQLMKVNNIKPENMTAISEHVADLLSDKEGQPCRGSTLRRQSGRYRKHIDTFMEEMGYEEITPPKSNSILELQLLIRQLKQENKALEKQLSNEFAKNALLAHEASDSILEKVDDKPIPKLDEAAYHKIMLKLIQEIGYQIDTFNRRVFDDLTLQVIFTEEDMPSFFRWYDEVTKS